ncbi:MAG TPA: hypothetical protein VKA49_18785 [Flavitalea sp.]|nr:hypothetical protein [Flavitalea sp.]
MVKKTCHAGVIWPQNLYLKAGSEQQSDKSAVKEEHRGRCRGHDQGELPVDYFVTFSLKSHIIRGYLYSVLERETRMSANEDSLLKQPVLSLEEI